MQNQSYDKSGTGNFSSFGSEGLEQVKKVKQWSKFWKSHKYKSAESLNLTQLGKETEPYRITFRNISGISYSLKDEKDKKVNNLAVKIYATTYSKKQKIFFGRTFESIIYPLGQGSRNTYQLARTSPVSIYYHINTQPDAQIYIIVEIHIFEMGDNDVVFNSQSLGWIEINALDVSQDQEPTTLTLKKGSPREMLAAIDPNLSLTEIQIQYTLIKSTQFNRAKHLIPSNILAGSNELVPGVNPDQKGNVRLPNAIEDVPIDLQPTCKVYIKQIQFKVNEQIEIELQKQLQKLASQGGVDKQGSASIVDRRIAAAYHNGWTVVNSRGLNNAIGLKIGQAEQRKIKEEQIISIKNLEYVGMHEIDNVFVHEYGMLIIQLEYEVELVNSQGRTRQVKVLGWVPIPIANYLSQQEQQLDEDLLQGPGKTVGQQSLVELNKSDDNIIRCLMIVACSQTPKSFQKQQYSPENAFSEQKIDKGGMGQTSDLATQSQQFIQQQQKSLFQPSMNPQNQNNIYQQQQQVDQNQEIEALKLKLQLAQVEKENLSRQQQMNTTYPPGSQPPQPYVVTQIQGESISSKDVTELKEMIELMKKKETQLLQEIAQMKSDQHKSELAQTKNFEELKYMLSTAQVRPQTAQARVQSSGRGGDQEVVLQDEAEIQRWKILDQLTSVPRNRGYISEEQKAFVVPPQYGTKDLTKADRAYLLHCGVKGILDDTGDQNFDLMLEESNLKVDLQDVLKANNILIQFLAMKPHLSNFTMEGGDQVKSDSLFSENYYIPERLQFSFNFFDFPTFKTDSITYENAGDVAAMKQCMTEGQPFVLMLEGYQRGTVDHKEPIYRFQVDPSKSNYKNMHSDFIYYLYRKMLHVDIWDADNLMLYGTVKIPLRGLLRQNKQKMTMAKQLDILEPTFSRVKGGLQVQLTMIGQHVALKVEQKEKIKDVKVWNTIDNASKKKVKSQNPVSIPSAYIKTGKDESIQSDDKYKDENERKRERIRRYKMNQLQEALEGELNQDIAETAGDNLKKKDAKLRLVQEISRYKEQKKPLLVKNILSEFLSAEKILNVFFGKTDIVPFDFENPEKQSQGFQIIIEDPDAKFLPQNEQELNLISRPAEWQFWVEKLGLNRPLDYNMIKDDVLILEPGEKATILFKFITYRSADASLMDNIDVQSIVEAKDNAYRSKYINKRNINVYIKNMATHSTTGFKLLVEPHMQILDHLFRYYERENRSITLVLPSLYHFTEPPKDKPILKVTNKSALTEWISDKEISIQINVPPVSEILRFNLLAYRDSYYSELMGNWGIELHSLEGVDLTVNMGQLTNAKLTIPADIPRTVRLYSSHPFVVWFPAPHNTRFPLSQSKINVVSMNVRSFSHKTHKVQINCVDINSKELIHSWIVRVDTQSPSVKQIFEITCPVGLESIQRFFYQNRANGYAIYNFQSSSPDIIEIIESRVAIDINKKEEIRIRIPPKYDPGLAEVFVFVNDQDEKIFDCLLFKVKFSQK